MIRTIYANEIYRTSAVILVNSFSHFHLVFFSCGAVGSHLSDLFKWKIRNGYSVKVSPKAYVSSSRESVLVLVLLIAAFRWIYARKRPNKHSKIFKISHILISNKCSLYGSSFFICGHKMSVENNFTLFCQQRGC
jgi:hypothetical protein